MNFNAYSLVTGQVNLIPAPRYKDERGVINVQVHSFKYNVASMVEVKEFVVNFEEKKSINTLNAISRLIGCSHKSFNTF